jgi:hypothetical protein
LQPVSLKGIVAPVMPYRLLKAHEHTRRILQSRTSFVGRNLEMTQLMTGINQAAAAHRVSQIRLSVERAAVAR